MAIESGMALAALVIGSASAVASGVQGIMQARAQQEYNEAQAEQYRKSYEQNTKAAAQEYANQSAAERVSQMQEKEKTSIEIQEAQKEALQKAGTMMASTNAAGGTLNFLMDDYTRQEAQAKEKYRTQYKMNAVASEFALQGYKNKAQNRIDSMSGYTYMDGGNGIGSAVLSTALGIGGAYTNAYMMDQKLNKPDSSKVTEV